jgi:hypothetical protein
LLFDVDGRIFDIKHRIFVSFLIDFYQHTDEFGVFAQMPGTQTMASGGGFTVNGAPEIHAPENSAEDDISSTVSLKMHRSSRREAEAAGALELNEIVTFFFADYPQIAAGDIAADIHPEITGTPPF